MADPVRWAWEQHLTDEEKVRLQAYDRCDVDLSDQRRELEDRLEFNSQARAALVREATKRARKAGARRPIFRI